MQTKGNLPVYISEKQTGRKYESEIKRHQIRIRWSTILEIGVLDYKKRRNERGNDQIDKDPEFLRFCERRFSDSGSPMNPKKAF